MCKGLIWTKTSLFSDSNDLIIFSSEIKPLLKLTKATKLQLEDKEIYKYLNFNFYGDSNLTFFKGIYQLQPGSFGYLKDNKIKIKKRLIQNNSTKKINTKYTLEILKNEISEHLYLMLKWQ